MSTSATPNERVRISKTSLATMRPLALRPYN
jgi:hypothetical protein